MEENTSTTLPIENNGYPDYPGFGDRDDVHARIMLLDWITEQIVNGHVQVKAGDFVLATDGRILGVGEDSLELHNRVVAQEPSLANARLVGYRVPLSEY